MTAGVAVEGMTVTLGDGRTVELTQIPLWRVRHDQELGSLWRTGVPEVFVLNERRTPFGESWQRLSFALNPGMTGERWRALYDYQRAFTNGTGFDKDPRADYVNGRDLGAGLPAWDKTRVCGGATVTGFVDGGDLVVGILDGNQPAPALGWLLAHPWLYFHAVNVTAGGITRFPQNEGRPVLVPLVGSGVARIPLSQVERVPSIADPYFLGYRPA